MTLIARGKSLLSRQILRHALTGASFALCPITAGGHTFSSAYAAVTPEREEDTNESFGEARESFGEARESFGGGSEAFGGGSEAFGGGSEAFGGGSEAFGGGSEAFGGGNKSFVDGNKSFVDGDKLVVGSAIMPECYLNLRANLRPALARPLTFKSVSRHEYINAMREKEGLTYPIGNLSDDIEIQFYHETNADVAAAKWHRRVQRMPADDDHLFVKFCDYDLPTQEQLAAFDRLPLSHKVCFTARPQPALKSGVYIPDSGQNRVADGLQLSFISPHYFDSVALIQGKSGTPRKRCIVRV